MLRDASGDLLLQRIARPGTATHGLWGSSAAGHVRAEEPYGTAMRREIFEELGARPRAIRWVGKFAMEELDRKKFIGVFTAEVKEPLKPAMREIQELAFFSLDEIREGLLSGRLRATPTFSRVFDFYLEAGSRGP